jgi:hypothetical protein
MLIYSFIANEHAYNVQKCNRYTEFEYVPFKNLCNLTKFYIKLEDNGVLIFDEKSNLKYKGKLLINESRYFPDTKLVYELESTITFIGGLLILEKNVAQLIYSGSGLHYLNAFKGPVQKATKYEI